MLWIIFIVLWAIGWLLYLPIHRLPRATTKPRYHYSILIPARNEAHNLPILLTSLLHQIHKGDEIIVIDDESSDQTRNIAKTFGVRVIEGKPLPQGWTGKSWALYQGVEAAAHEQLVFLDADTKIEPHGWDRILCAYEAKAQPLSVQPLHVMKHSVETLSLLFNLLVVLSSHRFSLFQKDHSSFYGPCQVMSKSMYQKMGTHEATKGSIVEDVSMGLLLQYVGYQPQTYVGLHSISFRMYPKGLQAMIAGWSKNMASGFIKIPKLTALLLFLWLCGLIGLSIRIADFLFWQRYILAFFTYTLIVMQLWRMSKNITSRGFVAACCYPIHLLFFLFVFMKSLYLRLTHRTTNWNERDVAVK
ncbi:MAG: glycosyltransferase [Erysipelotrichaceae bacterium]